MKTLKVHISDETAKRLELLAERIGLSPEEIAQAGIADQLAGLDEEYEEAATQVLSKNVELYRRLS